MAGCDRWGSRRRCSRRRPTRRWPPFWAWRRSCRAWSARWTRDWRSWRSAAATWRQLRRSPRAARCWFACDRRTSLSARRPLVQGSGRPPDPPPRPARRPVSLSASELRQQRQVVAYDPVHTQRGEPARLSAVVNGPAEDLKAPLFKEPGDGFRQQLVVEADAPNRRVGIQPAEEGLPLPLPL